MAAKLKKGDKVVVLAGKDKGKQGEIAAVMPKDNKAVVEGVNTAIRHTKQSAASQGGRIAKAMPIDLSNLACGERQATPSASHEGDKGSASPRHRGGDLMLTKPPMARLRLLQVHHPRAMMKSSLQNA